MTSAPSLEERLQNESDPARRRDLIEDALCPPEPHLLDTCVLQNLDWVDRKIQAGTGDWSEERERELQQQFGVDLANDLLDLGTLYKRFEHDGGYPWLVCNAAVDEAAVLRNAKGDGVRQLIQFLIGHQEDWVGDAYPGIAQGLLLASRRARVSPLILRGLGVSSPEEVVDQRGPLAFLPDRGDRLVAAHALLANIPVILTTDRRTFWAHREQMLAFGVRVLRPSELLDLYIPYWDALSVEFERRRKSR
jgi:hypothetical protein